MPPPTASLKPAPASNVSAKAEKEKTGNSIKPDQSAYVKKQDELNKEIEGVKAQLVGTGFPWNCEAFRLTVSLYPLPRLAVTFAPRVNHRTTSVPNSRSSTHLNPKPTADPSSKPNSTLSRHSSGTPRAIEQSCLIS